MGQRLHLKLEGDALKRKISGDFTIIPTALEVFSFFTVKDTWVNMKRGVDGDRAGGLLSGCKSLAEVCWKQMHLSGHVLRIRHILYINI